HGATAIFDGADAIMLSAETATGRFPVETVSVMARIAERAERALLQSPARQRAGSARAGLCEGPPRTRARGPRGALRVPGGDLAGRLPRRARAARQVHRGL